MAQTKASKAKRSKAPKPKSTKRKNNRKPKTVQSRATRASTRSKLASRNGRSKASPAKAVSHAVGSAGKVAGQKTGQAASKAKIPLLAGGAALAGAVGGVVIGANRSGGKVLGVNLPQPKRVRIRSKDLAKAAKEVGRFGENVGDLTAELQRAREGLADGNAKQNSPIEVLLKGLTNRR
jgi:hypothetical protein